MSSSYTPILVGVVSLVSEILQSSKTTNFPFRTMDYSPWSSKILIDQNRLNKFMQVRIDATCMCTNFGGRGLSSFGDFLLCVHVDIMTSGDYVTCDCITLLHNQINKWKISRNKNENDEEVESIKSIKRRSLC